MPTSDLNQTGRSGKVSWRRQELILEFFRISEIYLKKKKVKNTLSLLPVFEEAWDREHNHSRLREKAHWKVKRPKQHEELKFYPRDHSKPQQKQMALTKFSIIKNTMLVLGLSLIAARCPQVKQAAPDFKLWIPLAQNPESAC